MLCICVFVYLCICAFVHLCICASTSQRYFFFLYIISFYIKSDIYPFNNKKDIHTLPPTLALSLGG